MKNLITMQELLDKYRKKELLDETVCTNIHTKKREALEAILKKYEDKKMTLAELIRIAIYEFIEKEKDK